jgi:hypothetical protein
MPRSRSVRRIGPVPAVRTGRPEVDRAQDAVIQVVNRLAANPLSEALAIEATVAPGLNKVSHGLQRPVRHFLWSSDGDGVVLSNRQADNTQPDRTLWVWSDGAASVRALLVLLPGV